MSDGGSGPASIFAMPLFAPSAPTRKEPVHSEPVSLITRQPLVGSFYFSCGDLFRDDVRAGIASAVAQVTIESDARIDREGFVQHEVKSFAGRRVQIELGDRAADGVQQLRPRFQRLRRYTAAAGLWLALRTPVEQRHFRAAFRKQFRGK